MPRLNILVFTISISLSGTALAGTTYFTPQKISTDLSIGALSGEAKERVYEPDEGGRKISQLNWKYKNAAIINGGIDWNFMPWVSLGASGWTTLASKGSQMDDYDWDLASQEKWTDHSTHPDTTLNYANHFDLNLTGWIFNKTDYRLGFMAGYQQSAFSWVARGGSYNYDNGSEVGEFDRGVDGIAYKQKFKTPYIGITGLYRYNQIEFNGAVKYSAWGKATDNDEHYLRDLTFREKISDQQFYSLAADIGYYVTPQAKVFIGATWNRMLNKKGDTSVVDNETKESEFSADSAGIEHSNYLINAGIKYRF